jgi:polysaccharide biosynthesis/export protein
MKEYVKSELHMECLRQRSPTMMPIAGHAIGSRAAAALSLAFVLAILTGCATTPGQALPFVPEPQRLLDSAKDMRAANPQPAPWPRELNKTLLPPFVVEPGDGLLVQPAELDSPVRLPGDQTVMPDGTIDLGKYGRIAVAGKTLEVIEKDVRQAIEAVTKDAGAITVRLVNRQSKVYYVLGEVNAPGSFPINGRETVLDGIIAAGGVNHQAAQRNIILSRPTTPDGCRIVLPICYRQIVQLGDTSTNYQLMPGDRIFVPSRTTCEKLFSPKDECPPCNAAQTPCPVSLGNPCGLDSVNKSSAARKSPETETAQLK